MGNVAPILAAAVDGGRYLSPPGGMRAQLDTANACQACHRGLDADGAVTKANYPRMADCLVCHTKIDPPFSCPTCHVQGANLKPASHTPDFLDSHTAGIATLDRSGCAICHGREFRCLGCH